MTAPRDYRLYLEDMLDATIDVQAVWGTVQGDLPGFKTGIEECLKTFPETRG